VSGPWWPAVREGEWVEPGEGIETLKITERQKCKEKQKNGWHKKSLQKHRKMKRKEK